MKTTVRLSTLAATLAALVTLSFSASTVQAASVVRPKPVQPPVVTPDDHPIPNCPINDPNGCGIYSN